MKVFLNELTHDRHVGESSPAPSAVAWVHRENDTRRQADPPQKGQEWQWQAIPLWREMPECDSAWHRPTQCDRPEAAKDVCPYCGETAKADLARRRKLGPANLTDAEKKN